MNSDINNCINFIDEIFNPHFSIKAIGRQWYWSCEYPEFHNHEINYINNYINLDPFARSVRKWKRKEQSVARNDTLITESDTTRRGVGWKLSINRVAAWPEAWRVADPSRNSRPSQPRYRSCPFCFVWEVVGEEMEAHGFQLPPRVSPTRKLYRTPMMHRPEMAEVVPGRKCAAYVGGHTCVRVAGSRVIPCLAVIQIPPLHK